MTLKGRRIVVGVCGSIAAYKAAEVVRGLIKTGAEVRVVMTAAATKFVGPATFAALTGHPVHTDIFDEPERVIHVELGRWADAYLVCGATASTLARFANGTGEEIVSAVYLMCHGPVVVAPAMHTEMWEHAGVQRNVDRVSTDGAIVVPPGEGDLASGDYGVGRLADPAAIVDALGAALAPKDLAGVRVLVTAGPTREPLDPVRFLSNRSTGRMGFAIASQAHRRGASVVVVAGPTSVPAPSGLEIVRVETAAQMHDECVARFDDADVAILNAAVADWRPADVADEKLKKADASRQVAMEPTTDIAAELGARKGDRLVIVFAAETSRVIEHAQDKLRSKNADLVVANQVGRPGTGFESETNEASFVSSEGVEEQPRLAKDDLAAIICDRIVKMRVQRAG